MYEISPWRYFISTILSFDQVNQVWLEEMAVIRRSNSWGYIASRRAVCDG